MAVPFLFQFGRVKFAFDVHTNMLLRVSIEGAKVEKIVAAFFPLEVILKTFDILPVRSLILN